MKWDNRFLKIILVAKTAKRKEKEVFIRYECKTAEGRRNFTTPCTTAGTSWRFSCFSLVFQTCILSRFVSFVFFLLRFFFSSSSLRAIDEYQFFLCFIYFIIYRTPFVFFFLVFLYLLDSVPSLTSFSFPSSYNCFFYYVSRPLFILRPPPQYPFSHPSLCYIAIGFPNIFFFFFFSPLLCSFSFSSYSLFPYFSFVVVTPEGQL